VKRANVAGTIPYVKNAAVLLQRSSFTKGDGHRGKHGYDKADMIKS